MSKQQAPLEYLSKFIPAAAVPRVLEYLHQYKVHLTITRENQASAITATLQPIKITALV